MRVVEYLVFKNNSLVLCKTSNDVFISSIVRTFSFGERLIVPFNTAIASLNGTINLSPHENILTIGLINIQFIICILLQKKTYTKLNLY